MRTPVQTVFRSAALFVSFVSFCEAFGSEWNEMERFCSKMERPIVPHNQNSIRITGYVWLCLVNFGYVWLSLVIRRLHFSRAKLAQRAQPPPASSFTEKLGLRWCNTSGDRNAACSKLGRLWYAFGRPSNSMKPCDLHQAFTRWPNPKNSRPHKGL